MTSRRVESDVEAEQKILEVSRRHYELNRRHDYPEGLDISPHWKRCVQSMASVIPTFETPAQAIAWGSASTDLVHAHNRVARYSPISTIHELLTFNLTRVLEIGSGMGNLAATLRANSNPEHAAMPEYTLVDLPESLFFAEVYLRMRFPEATFGHHLRGVDFRLVPVQDFGPGDRPFDVAINNCAFSTMTTSTVQYWMKVIRQTSRNLYSLDLDILPIELTGWRVRSDELLDGDDGLLREICMRNRRARAL